MSALRTIVVGYDASGAADRALERAAEIAERFQARLVVLAVASSPRLPASEAVPAEVYPALTPAGPVGPIPLPPEVETAPPPWEQEEPAARTLERARGALATRHPDAEFVSAIGDPVDMLLEAADDRDADLIVVGSPEHSFLERLLGGGVDDKVARRAHRDVLLVH